MAPHRIVSAVWVHLAAWQAMVERLGWQVYVTNTTTTHYRAPTLVASYHQQALEERGFSRLKTRNLRLSGLCARRNPHCRLAVAVVPGVAGPDSDGASHAHGVGRAW